jgi:hypothetical protein
VAHVSKKQIATKKKHVNVNVKLSTKDLQFQDHFVYDKVKSFWLQIAMIQMPIKWTFGSKF